MLSTIALGRPYWGISWEVLFTRDKKKFLNISRRKEKPWRARIRKELTLSQSFIQEDNGAMSPELHGKWSQPKILYSARLLNVRIKKFANVHILFFFFFLAAPRATYLIRDQIHTPCSESAESWLLDHQGSYRYLCSSGLSLVCTFCQNKHEGDPRAITA